MGVTGQNDIWMLVLWLSTKYIIKGEGGGFPQVWTLMSIVNPCLLMVHLCTKVFQLRINQLVVWFVQVRVSNSIACQFFLSHPRVLARPFTPKVLQAKECAPTPYPSVVFTFGLAVKSIKELGGVSFSLIFQ